MKISIIGASRGIGLELLHRSLAEGHQVTALLRKPDQLGVSHPRLTVIAGDLLDPAAAAKATANQDAVCMCVGIPPTRKPVTLFSRGTANLLAAMTQNTKPKLIVITGLGAGDSKGHGGFLYDRLFQPLLLGTIYADKDRQEAMIKDSQTDWLIVRPGFLTDGPLTGSYRVIDNLAGITAGKISRADVADFMLKQLATPSYFGKTPLLTY